MNVIPQKTTHVLFLVVFLRFTLIALMIKFYNRFQVKVNYILLYFSCEEKNTYTKTNIPCPTDARSITLVIHGTGVDQIKKAIPMIEKEIEDDVVTKTLEEFMQFSPSHVSKTFLKKVK